MISFESAEDYKTGNSSRGSSRRPLVDGSNYIGWKRAFYRYENSKDGCVEILNGEVSLIKVDDDKKEG